VLAVRPSVQGISRFLMSVMFPHVYHVWIDISLLFISSALCRRNSSYFSSRPAQLNFVDSSFDPYSDPHSIFISNCVLAMRSGKQQRWTSTTKTSSASPNHALSHRMSTWLVWKGDSTDPPQRLVADLLALFSCFVELLFSISVSLALHSGPY
jgi:hypothetical protein